MMRSQARLSGALSLLAILCACLPLPAAEPIRDALPIALPPQGVLRELTVYPSRLTLNGPRDVQRFIVLGMYDDGRNWDLTRTARYLCDNAALAKVAKDGSVSPVRDGSTQIVVAAAGKTVRVPLVVRHSKSDEPVSFSREIVPTLTKSGCNQGACHGSQHGRGGFRLSLFGFDPAFDHTQIVQSAEGRRVVPSDPERSILLLKPTLTMEHGGGERFKVNTRSYNLLKRWLEGGAPAPNAKDPIVT